MITLTQGLKAQDRFYQALKNKQRDGQTDD
jgi:hypothetical protein